MKRKTTKCLLLILTLLCLASCFFVLANASSTSTNPTYTMCYFIDGLKIKTVTCESGKTYKIANFPQIQGYYWEGWNTYYSLQGKTYAPGDFYSYSPKKSGDVVNLYAFERPNTYYVHYYINDVLSYKQTCTYNEEANVYVPNANFDARWNSKKDLSGHTLHPGETFKNLTDVNERVLNYYTYTNISTIDVGFKSTRGSSKDDSLYTLANGGVLVSLYSGERYYQAANKYGTYKFPALTDFVKSPDGYTFKGWYNEADGSSSTVYPAGTVVNVSDLTKTDVVDTYTEMVQQMDWVDGNMVWVEKPLTIERHRQSILLHAKYVPNTYTVKLAGYVNGSSDFQVSSTTTYKYGEEKALKKNTLVKRYTVTYDYGDGRDNTTASPACSFLGWAKTSSGDVVYTDGQKVKNLTAENNATVTLYAKFGSASTTLPKPTRTGYTFLGWYDAKTGGNKVGNGGDTITLKTNKTYYGRWQVNSYTIKYVLNGGSFPQKNNSVGTNSSSGKKYYYNPTTLKYMGTPASGFGKYFKVEYPTKAGYVFNGWTVTGLGSNKHYVWYNGKENTSTATSWTNTSNEGKAKEFYNLRSTSGTVTFTANWKANSLKIYYNANGGAVKQNTTTSGTQYYNKLTGDKYIVHSTNSAATSKCYNQIGFGSSLDPINATTFGLTRAGYTFAGWNTKADGSGTTFDQDTKYTATDYCPDLKDGDKAITLYAKWVPNTLKVYYNANGGSLKASTTMSGKTYYHRLVENNYIVHSTNKNATSKCYQTLKYNTAQDFINATTFGLSREGYTFAGWNPKSDGSGTTYDEDTKYTPTTLSPSLKNGNQTLVLYAKWERNTVKISFHANGGTVKAVTMSGNKYYNKLTSDNYIIRSTNSTATAKYIQQFNYNTAHDLINASSCGLTKSGYTFAGWNTKQDGSGSMFDETTNYLPSDICPTILKKSATMTLYARWKKINTLRIAYNANGGTTTTTVYTFNDGKICYASGSRYVQTAKSNETVKVAYTSTFTMSRTGYTFNGWFVSGGDDRVFTAANPVKATELCPAVSNSDQTIYLKAKWTPIQYTVKYGDGGATSGSTAASTHKYDTAKALTKNGFVRKVTVTFKQENGKDNIVRTANCGFAGWQHSNGTIYSNEQQVKNLTAYNNVQITMTAIWNPAAIQLPTVEKSGYKFLGWYSADGKKIGNAGATCSFNSNTTLTAKWEKNPNTITLDHVLFGFKNQEGTTSSKNGIHLKKVKQSVANGGSFTFSTSNFLTSLPNGVVRYSSQVWSSTTPAGADGTWQGYSLPQTFSNITTNAYFQFKYILKNYTITYDYAGGTAPSNANPTTYNVVYGASFDNEPTRDGYTFVGWTLSGSTNYVYGVNVSALPSSAFVDDMATFAAAVKNRTTGNITVTANWSKNRDKTLVSPFAKYSYAQITSLFGQRESVDGSTGSFHGGIDMSAYLNEDSPTLGKDVMAAGSGTVIMSEFNAFGNCVKIDHGDGLVTLYGHLNDKNVEVGDYVYEGQVIGHAGTTYGPGGYSSGPHLHFETRINNVRVDPLDYCDFSMNRPYAG